MLSGSRIFEDIEALQERELVAGDKVGLTVTDQVGRMNGMRPEAQMRDRHRTRLFRVIDKVALRIVVGLFANDLDRVLVRAHGAVRAQAPEDALHDILVFEGELRIIIQAGMGHIVVNANRKVVFRLRLDSSRQRCP